MVNSKLTVGIHMLTLLALAGATPLSSEAIAGSVNTNPVVIRRLLALLRRAGYVGSASGPGGGWRLTRSPGDITLADIRRAIEQDREVFPLHNNMPAAGCAVGGNIQGVLIAVYDGALGALDRQLGSTTVADILQSIRAKIAAK